MKMRQRWLEIAGIAFVVLVVVSVVVVAESTRQSRERGESGGLLPQTQVGLEGVDLRHRASRSSWAWVSSGSSREHLAFVKPASKPLATLGFFGALLFGVSGAVASGISWSLADSVGHVDPTVVQMLNVLNFDLNAFVGAPGIALFLGATGVRDHQARWTARLARLGWCGARGGCLGDRLLRLPRHRAVDHCREHRAPRACE